MANPQLNEKQLEIARKLLIKIRKDIARLAKDDTSLIFAFNRHIRKRLEFDERGTPVVRRKIKNLMWKRQKGMCAICKKELPEKYTELDRFDAKAGYIETNVQLVHHECHINSQAEKGYK